MARAVEAVCALLLSPAFAVRVAAVAALPALGSGMPDIIKIPTTRKHKNTPIYCSVLLTLAHLYTYLCLILYLYMVSKKMCKYCCSNFHMSSTLAPIV